MSEPSDFTPRLGLPYLLPHQAQKHVTLNESLSRLDSLVMASVAAAAVNSPPDQPDQGQSWLIGPVPEGDWLGQAGKLVTFLDGGWAFQTPRAGWIIWDEATGELKVHDGQDWLSLPHSASRPVLQNIDRFGLAATASSAQPFIVQANQAAFAALEHTEGGTGDLRISLNKSASPRTASLVFQNGWSGRGEIGLTGDDRLSLKISADGTSWLQGLALDAETGFVETDFHLVPGPGGDSDLGQATRPFRDLYLVRAPSVTSDVRGKRDVQPLMSDVALDLVKNLQPVSFRHKEAGHLHFGFTAQQVRDTLDNLGHEDVFLWRLADPDKADSTQMICQEELIAVLLCAVQNLIDRITLVEESKNAVRHRQGRR